MCLRKLPGMAPVGMSAPMPMPVCSANVAAPAMAGNVAVPTTTACWGGRYRGAVLGVP